MLALRKHPLVNTDLQKAFDWHEDRRSGLGWEFEDDFKLQLGKLTRNAQLYAVRFADVRRLNLDRFPYGLFYVIRESEVWLLAVLHGSRDTEKVLAERRKYFGR